MPGTGRGGGQGAALGRRQVSDELPERERDLATMHLGRDHVEIAGRRACHQQGLGPGRLALPAAVLVDRLVPRDAGDERAGRSEREPVVALRQQERVGHVCAHVVAIRAERRMPGQLRLDRLLQATTGDSPTACEKDGCFGQRERRGGVGGRWPKQHSTRLSRVGPSHHPPGGLITVRSEVMRLLSVTGNRPQFVKAAPLHAALHGRVDLVSLDTGQHYDRELAALFYEDLGLAEPHIRLRVGSGSHAVQTARMLVGIESAIHDQRPDGVVVYGDTNSTLAAAIAAAKEQVPVAHVEAGLRSFDRRMPEEVNRVVADSLSALLLCPSQPAVENLAREGITRGVHVVGDVMVDVARIVAPAAAARSEFPGELGLERGGYLLATVHRQSNTEQPSLGRIVEGLISLSEPVVLPLHPRTRAALERDGLMGTLEQRVRVLPPLGYGDFTALLLGARLCLTDSGGVQKEAYLHGVPCVTLRDTSEWVETIEAGWNVLVGDDPEELRNAVAQFAPPAARPELYGDGHAAERIASLLADGSWTSRYSAPA
jgi:UDP-GlcNAc3NAcA epimerase